MEGSCRSGLRTADRWARSLTFRLREAGVVVINQRHRADDFLFHGTFAGSNLVPRAAERSSHLRSGA